MHHTETGHFSLGLKMTQFPAASAMGGRFLSRLDDALVVDVGGQRRAIVPHVLEVGQVLDEGESLTNRGSFVHPEQRHDLITGQSRGQIIEFDTQFSFESQ